MKTIRWGIIGCGAVTEVKSGPGFQKAKNSRLIAVMRRSGQLARDYARRHNVPKWYDSSKKLIEDPEVDAVYIATPPSSHKDLTQEVAKAGKPAYVEKPMANSFDECQKMISYCKDHNVPLFVAYYRRALSRFTRIKSMLEEGVIGSIRFVNVTFYQKPYNNDLQGKKHWRVNPEIAVGGYFFDLASHMFDIIQFLVGTIVSVSGQSSNQMELYPAEDMVSCIFKFESGLHGAGVWNFNSYGNLDRTEIVGDKGKITFSTFGESPIVVESLKGIQKIKIKNPAHIQQPLIQTIVNELLGDGKCPSRGESGAQTNWVMEKILGLP
jgi:predicted dehydrogenase